MSGPIRLSIFCFYVEWVRFARSAVGETCIIKWGGTLLLNESCFYLCQLVLNSQITVNCHNPTNNPKQLNTTFVGVVLLSVGVVLLSVKKNKKDKNLYFKFEEDLISGC